MRLQRLRLRNFRSHQNTVFDLDRMNFIRGLNRTGKTSIRLGIQMVLTGRCDVTSEDGKGFEALIQEGKQTALIELGFDDTILSLKLDRSSGRTYKVEHNNTTIIGPHAQDWIAEHFGLPDVLSACLDAYRFLAMRPNEQASLLAQVLLPKQLELPDDMAAMLAATQLQIVERSTLIGTIEATHAAIADARTVVNRRIRDLKNLPEPAEPQGNRDDVKAKLAELQAEQHSLEDKLNAAESAVRTHKSGKERIEEFDRQIADCQSKLTNVPKPLTAARRKELQKVADLAQKHYQLTGEIASHKATVKGLTNTLEAFINATEIGTCPTCGSTLTEEQRTTVCKPLQDQCDYLNGLILQLEQQIEADGDPHQALVELQTDTENIRRRQWINDTLEHVRTQRNSVERQLTEFPLPPEQGPESIPALGEAIKTLRNRHTKGLDVLVKIVELEKDRETYEAQIAERTVLETRLVDIEKLLEYFGPSGLAAKLVAERLDLFTAKVNNVLAWWGYAMAFSIEPFALKVYEEGYPPLTPRQLSASERYRLGIAFAVAIAEWTGFKFLLCDAAEILDKPDKWQLAQLLLQSDLDQAILFSTGVAGTFEAAGAAFFTLSKDTGTTVIQLDSQTAETQAQMVG